MHLRWSCTENTFQRKTIVSGTYDGLAVNRKSQHALTISIFLYKPIIYFSKIHYTFYFLQVRIYNTTQCYSSIPWPRLWSLCRAQICFCKIVQNTLTMVFLITGRGSYVMVDKIKAQNETSTSQKFTNLQIVGDLTASTTAVVSYWDVVISWLKMFLDVGIAFLF